MLLTNIHQYLLHTIESASVTWSSRVKYLDVVITSNLKWNDHCQRIVQKATRSLNRLQGTMYG